MKKPRPPAATKIARHTGNSKAGRQIMAQQPRRREAKLSQEVLEWNKQVDLKKAKV